MGAQQAKIEIESPTINPNPSNSASENLPISQSTSIISSTKLVYPHYQEENDNNISGGIMTSRSDNTIVNSTNGTMLPISLYSSNSIGNMNQQLQQQYQQFEQQQQQVENMSSKDNSSLSGIDISTSPSASFSMTMSTSIHAYTRIKPSAKQHQRKIHKQYNVTNSAKENYPKYLNYIVSELMGIVNPNQSSQQRRQSIGSSVTECSSLSTPQSSDPISHATPRDSITTLNTATTSGNPSANNSYGSGLISIDEHNNFQQHQEDLKIIENELQKFVNRGENVDEDDNDEDDEENDSYNGTSSRLAPHHNNRHNNKSNNHSHHNSSIEYYVPYHQRSKQNSRNNSRNNSANNSLVQPFQALSTSSLSPSPTPSILQIEDFSEMSISKIDKADEQMSPIYRIPTRNFYRIAASCHTCKKNFHSTDELKHHQMFSKEHFMNIYDENAEIQQFCQKINTITQ